MNVKKCVVLLSGGLDSATVAAVAKSKGFSLYALTFIYGQRHGVETEFAQKTAKHLSVVSHHIVELPECLFNASSLVTASGKDIHEHNTNDIPDTYVPARNIVFLSIALSYAENIGAGNIYIGVNAVDFSGYPDCRPHFIDSFQRMIEIGTKSGVEGSPIIINAPLINMTKAEIISLGISLGVDYSLTISCYNPTKDAKPCKICDSCRLRHKGFAQAGLHDPASQ